MLFVKELLQSSLIYSGYSVVSSTYDLVGSGNTQKFQKHMTHQYIKHPWIRWGNLSHSVQSFSVCDKNLYLPRKGVV